MKTKTLFIAAVTAAALIAAGEARAASCPTDVDGDGAVAFGDLTALLAAWGPCGTGDCRADFDDSGDVGFGDLTTLLATWGVCETAEILAIELAGLPLGGYPHFTPYALFSTEQTTRIGVDPSVAPELIGRQIDAYVVEARSGAEWRINRTLSDVRGASQSMVFAGPGLADSIIALDGVLSGDGGLGFGVAYDLVLDVDGDGSLSDGDAIDGYGDEPGFTVIGDLTAPGPLSVTTANFGEDTFVAQRVYYPTAIGAMGPLPLVVIGHGNFMQYVWYDYLGEHLASHGYIVTSHFNDTMPGIENAAISTLTNTEYLLANQATLLDGALDGHIDSSRIVWIGHSRGGEGVVHAYDLVRDGLIVPSTFGLEDIALISSIAPTSWLDFTQASPGAVPYHLLFGAADGDVFGGAASELIQSFRVYERATGWRCSTYVHGADHNDFNCCGREDYCLIFTDGPCSPDLAIGREEGNRVAKATYLTLFKLLLDGHEVAEELLWRQHENLQFPGVDPGTIIDREFREPVEAGDFVIDDFQSEPSTTVSSSGGAVSVGVTNLVEDKLAESNTTFTWTFAEPMNAMTRAGATDWTRGAIFDYTQDAFLEFEIIPSQRDLTDARALSFRACQASRHPYTVAVVGDLVFSVTLRDGAGTTSTIRIGAYGGGLEEPFERSGQGQGVGWQNEFETIRIRPADFAADGSALDLSDIVAVRFDFGPSYGAAFGRIGLDDVEIVRD